MAQKFTVELHWDSWSVCSALHPQQTNGCCGPLLLIGPHIPQWELQPNQSDPQYPTGPAPSSGSCARQHVQWTCPVCPTFYWDLVYIIGQWSLTQPSQLHPPAHSHASGWHCLSSQAHPPVLVLVIISGSCSPSVEPTASPLDLLPVPDLTLSSWFCGVIWQDLPSVPALISWCCSKTQPACPCSGLCLYLWIQSATPAWLFPIPVHMQANEN